MPYAFMIRGWQIGGSVMGNVYAEDFARRADEVAAGQLESRKNDPYLPVSISVKPQMDIDKLG